MKTLILNGSPRGKQGNTEVFIRHFLAGAGEAYPVSYVAKEPVCELAKKVSKFDTVLIFVPLYIHAMPGIVLKLFEQMQRAREGQKIGFIVQAGFMEGSQCRFLVRYFNAFAKRLGYENLGVVTRGDAAGTSMMPSFFNKRLFRLLHALGSHYASNKQFDEQTAALLGGWYDIPPSKIKYLEFLTSSGINHILWKKFWRDNGVSGQGLARPFA